MQEFRYEHAYKRLRKDTPMKFISFLKSRSPNAVGIVSLVISALATFISIGFAILSLLQNERLKQLDLSVLNAVYQSKLLPIAFISLSFLFLAIGIAAWRR